jgi:hypothetical protein
MQLQQFAPCHAFYIFETRHSTTLKQSFGVCTQKRTDHARIIFRDTESVKQLKAALPDNRPAAPYNTNTARKSFTLVWVGPVTTKSPKGSKNPTASFSNIHLGYI